MDNYFIDDAIKSSHIFESLDAPTIKLISSKFTEVNLSRNTVLFYQGDPSDSVYLLVSGKLAAQLMSGLGEKQVVGHVFPGETVGEMGVLSNTPRSLTIKALTDSILLKIELNNFIEILHQYPSVMYALVRPLISRSEDIIKKLSISNENKYTVIVPAHQKISLEKFFESLYACAEKFPNTLIISDYQPEFHDKNISISILNEKIKSLIANRKSVKRICYITSSFDTPIARVGFQHANMVYIAAYDDSEQIIDSHILDKIKSRHSHLMTHPSLILLHTSETVMPISTSNWTKLTKFLLCHHVHMDKTKDFLKLLRFIRGKATGLVLSGGGTRGWAHIGVIKALRESKIPIDIIGGTSVGALVAGIYAMNQSYEQTYEQFKQLVIESKNTISWRSLTWPIISLFNSRNYTNGLIKIFGNRQIEDLAIPFFCITSNLTNNSEDIHQSGSLWETIRASTALPGMIPPMLLDGEIHIDGGLLNNLPVDIMRNFVGRTGKVVAVELNNFNPDTRVYDFPPIVTFKDVFLNKLRIKKYRYIFPSFMDTFVQGLLLSSSLRDRQNAIIANMYVNFDLSQFSMLHTNLDEGNKLVQIGYEETLKQINKHLDPKLP